MHNTQEQNAQQKDEKQVRSVFVGNIPYEATDDELKNIFSKIGPVLSFRIVYDRETGKPKGYGFCEYRDIETAQSAIRNLNGLELHSRTLRVDSAVNEKGKEEQKEAKIQEIPTCGPAVSSESASETIGKFMASMPPEQAFELLQQTKICIHNNPDESREMLIRNPQLGFALLQALILLKLVDPKMIDQLILKQPKVDAPPSPIMREKDFAPREVRAQNEPDKLAIPKILPGAVPHRMPPSERVHDYAHQKSHRHDSPHDNKYPRPPFNTDFKKPQKIPPQGIDDYYEKSPSHEYGAHAPPSFQASNEYQYFERERGHKSHYPPSAYEPYPHDQQPIQSSRPDNRVPFRRDRERISPRDARPYDDRDARHIQKSPIIPVIDPRLQSSLPISQYDDHGLDRRERDYPANPHHSSQQHPSEPRYRQSRFH